MYTQAVLARAFVCNRNVCSAKVVMMVSCSLISEWRESFSLLAHSAFRQWWWKCTHMPSMIRGKVTARHEKIDTQHSIAEWIFPLVDCFLSLSFPSSAAFCRSSAFTLLLVFDLWLCIRWNERKLARMSVNKERHTFVSINSLCKQKWNCSTGCFFAPHSLGLRSFSACKQTHNSQNGKVKPRQSSLSSCSPPPRSRYSFRMCSWFVCSFSLTQNSHFHTVYASAVRCGTSISSPFIPFRRFASVDCLAKSPAKGKMTSRARGNW